MHWNYLILHIIIIEFFIYIHRVSTNNEPQVAFNCGRPSNILKNNQWTLDFQQDCIEDEAKLVQFCQKSFPLLKIITAEPAIQKVNFKNWCDFSNQSCEVDVKIRPFKCLDKSFQSDALVLPQNCQFEHLFNESECLIYKDWMKRAANHCIQKKDWIIKSCGMLFPCGNDKNIKPMFFKGVEFVCCPHYESKDTDDSDVNIYKNYINNAVFETKQGEQQFYEDAKKRLVQSEKEKESKIINDFIESEKDFEKLWKTDPENAKKKEKNIHSNFKIAYNSMQNQFAQNRKQLLNYHYNHLEIIFNTEFEAATKNFEEVLKKSYKMEDEIFESMKTVFMVLMNRKRYLMAELEEVQKVHLDIGDRIKNHIQLIDKLISDLFDKLKKVPEFQFTVKKKLMNYLKNIYPIISKPIKIKDSIYDDSNKPTYQDIIAEYKHHSENRNSNNNKFSIHHDLGMNDPDQVHSDFSKWEEIAHNEDRKLKNFFNGKPLLGIIFGLLLAMVVLLIVVFTFVLRHRRQKNSGYSNPKHQNEESHKIFHGFGANNSCNFSKNSKPNFYENLNYVTMLDQPLIKTNMENPNLENEEKSQTSIYS